MVVREWGTIVRGCGGVVVVRKLEGGGRGGRSLLMVGVGSWLFVRGGPSFVGGGS
jgi:hypothetical protein